MQEGQSAEGPVSALGSLDRLLNQTPQMWLLGAGISKEAGVPLMNPLTNYVGEELDEELAEEYAGFRKTMRNTSNVEDVLTRIGSLIELAEQTKDRKVEVRNRTFSAEELQTLHSHIQKTIREIVRCGYAEKGQESEKYDEDNKETIEGLQEVPILSIDDHIQFVTALFNDRRVAAESQTPISFFTTNYDTLLEDALALKRVRYVDGFTGGTVAFWDPEECGPSFETPLSKGPSLAARLYKLHGSIDWFASEDEVVVRRREEMSYSDGAGQRLLVYPQATKYLTTSSQPFSFLFRAFQDALTDRREGHLFICGYGFGDDHINDEIESAMARGDNMKTLVAFAQEVENTDGVFFPPHPLSSWLDSAEEWSERIVVVTDRGYYHGKLENTLEEPWEVDLWTFQGLTKFLSQGPESVKVA